MDVLMYYMASYVMQVSYNGLTQFRDRNCTNNNATHKRQHAAQFASVTEGLLSNLTTTCWTAGAYVPRTDSKVQVMCAVPNPQAWTLLRNNCAQQRQHLLLSCPRVSGAFHHLVQGRKKRRRHHTCYV